MRVSDMSVGKLRRRCAGLGTAESTTFDSTIITFDDDKIFCFFYKMATSMDTRSGEGDILGNRWCLAGKGT